MPSSEEKFEALEEISIKLERFLSKEYGDDLKDIPKKVADPLHDVMVKINDINYERYNK
jgi:hypothetical protein